jgi:septum formation protein
VNHDHPFLRDLGRPIVLASQSPRRAEILRAHGLEFTVEPAELDESALPDEAPAPHVERLALEKARAVADRHRESAVLGCDTVVVIDGEILGKPRDVADARATIARLAGREHRVLSSVAIVCTELDHAAVSHRVTRVRFRELDREEIARYVATGEPMDKAGSYGIQGHGALLVEGIEGDYFNVMGLPIHALREVWNGLAERRAQR